MLKNFQLIRNFVTKLSFLKVLSNKYHNLLLIIKLKFKNKQNFILHEKLLLRIKKKEYEKPKESPEYKICIQLPPNKCF